jgi:hypothetical protein
METVETDKNLENVELEKTVDSNDKEQDPLEEGEECSEDLVLSHQEVMIKVQSTLSDIISVRFFFIYMTYQVLAIK